MRLLLRNTTKFEYCAYTGLESDLNEDGLHTGVYKPVYDDPVEYRGNISAPSGRAVQAFDGLEIRYTHVLIMDKPDTDIDEYGKILWNGKTYAITAVRRTMNVLNVALMEQTEDHGDQDVTEKDMGGG